ncbi:uncharacterized protein LOC110973152 [Acanthaster planci]|uniref:Uncharacterized protein LOC110973152 n=1 Tax=Acanthaster planci TaxID=133434 RepID=A0A8B7XF80_ACAPL|nr:uncharacterized protein LOC110973152 [Acanthaster planci]
MMDASSSVTYCRLLLILLGVHAAIAFAKPRAKPEMGRGSTRIRAETSTTVESSRRSHRRRMGSPMSTEIIKNLAEYKVEIARKMTRVRTPEEFLRVFFTVDSVKSRWTKMVNESVQNAWRAGRTQDVEAERPTFTPETADQEMTEVNRHGVSVQCREPNPVLVDMYKELNLTRGGLVFVYPECTKVSRCDRSGCCQGGAPCVGKQSARVNITKPFIIVTIRHDSSRHKDARYLKHSVYADTECMCKERPQIPVCQPTVCSQTMSFDAVTCRCLCNKPCPRPYIQDPDTCDCRCDQKDGGCKKIKRSRRRMAATECTCVMDNRCLQPACNKGYTFSTSSCKCTATGSKQRNPNRKRDRNRDGRTDTHGDSPHPPPPDRRGRTNIDQVVPFDMSSGPNVVSDSLSSGSDDQEEPLSHDGLMVSWASHETGESEDCGASCQHQKVPQGSDNGSGGGGGAEGGVLDF